MNNLSKLEHIEKADTLQADVAELKNHVKAAGSSLYKTIVDTKSLAQKALNQTVDGVQSTAKDVKNNTATYFIKRPLKAIGLAFLVGVVSARLI